MKDTIIKWKKLDAGEYESSDGRFYILKSWDRIYGNHWQLWDRSVPDKYKGLYYEKTLIQCKVMAMSLLEKS